MHHRTAQFPQLTVLEEEGHVKLPPSRLTLPGPELSLGVLRDQHTLLSPPHDPLCLRSWATGVHSLTYMYPSGVRRLLPSRFSLH
jgi:hypothetical protein